MWKFQQGNKPAIPALPGGILLSFLDPGGLYKAAGQVNPIQKRTIPPLVSADWLAENLKDPVLTIVDVRDRPEYLSGHIPQSVNVPFSEWITTRDSLLLELPDEEALFNTISSAGINKGSKVVVVNNTHDPRPLADATRVADTLIYAGILNTTILDGGYQAWASRNKHAPAQDREISARAFKGNTEPAMFVNIEYVRSRLGKSLLLDARDPDVYFGLVQEPTAARPGHIPGARNLPAPWIWEQEGTYRGRNTLQQMAAGVTGNDRSKEIIIYCGVGGYAAAWWYVLTQILGYENVRIYDGSAQEWTADAQNPVISWVWE